MSDKKLSSHNKKTISSWRASSSVCRKGSITVEAALAAPLFFLAVISLFYLLEILAIRTTVRTGLQAAGHKAVAEVFPVASVSPAELESDLIEAIGKERLDGSIIQDGSAGIDCGGSYLSFRTGIGVIKAKYNVKMPLLIFPVPPLSYEESMRIKAWTGYEKNTFGEGREPVVYVTETGLVYHTDYHCSHLELKIQRIAFADTETQRNHDGGKYYPCEKCMHGSYGRVYITENGNRYHGSLSCSGLKRTIYAIPVSEAVGKGACSRCAG